MCTYVYVSMCTCPCINEQSNLIQTTVNSYIFLYECLSVCVHACNYHHSSKDNNNNIAHDKRSPLCQSVTVPWDMSQVQLKSKID